MNDLLIVGLFALIVSLIGIMTPIIKLNSNITTLNCSIDALREIIVRDEDELRTVKDTLSQQQNDIATALREIEILKQRVDNIRTERSDIL